MATATKYDLLAEEILRGVGGEHNVAAVTHCATRLRFQIKDRDKVDKAAVENTKGVITVVEAGGQFQVVIGNTVPTCTSRSRTAPASRPAPRVARRAGSWPRRST